MAAKINFLDGVFYSWRLSEKPWAFVAGEQRAAFVPRKIGEPAAAIALQDGQAVVISGAGQAIRLVAAPGVRFEIAVTNLPARADQMNMNHALHYYDAIEAKVTRWEPVQYNGIVYPAPIICGPMIFSRSHLN